MFFYNYAISVGQIEIEVVDLVFHSDWRFEAGLRKSDIL